MLKVEDALFFKAPLLKIIVNLNLDISWSENILDLGYQGVCTKFKFFASISMEKHFIVKIIFFSEITGDWEVA